MTAIELPIHPEYVENFRDWQECRDAYKGETAVKKRSEEYLPRPAGINVNLYEQYIRGACWYGATARAVGGLLGTIIRKPPQIEGIDSEDLKEVGKYGETLYAMTRDSMLEVLQVSRVGIFIDAPADAAKDPFIVLYQAEDIVFWEFAYSPKYKKDLPVFVLLQEATSTFDRETLEFKQTYRFRALMFNEAGQYCQQLFAADDGAKFKPGQTVALKPISGLEVVRRFGGSSFDYIPFFFQSANSLRPNVETPVILDLVKVNMSHYRLTADHKWALHWTALPTPWATGVDELDAEGKPNKVPIGSTNIYMVSNPEARFGMLETTGNGIPSIAKELEKEERQMAVLGSRLLEEGKGNTDVAEAIKMRLAGDSATLGSIALTASEVWTLAMKRYLEWKYPGRKTDDVLVKINTDFNMRRMDSQEIIMLTTAYNERAISFEQLHYNLQRGEIVPETLTAEEHWKQIQARGGEVSVETITKKPGAVKDDEDDEDDDKEEQTSVEDGVA